LVLTPEHCLLIYMYIGKKCWIPLGMLPKNLNHNIYVILSCIDSMLNKERHTAKSIILKKNAIKCLLFLWKCTNQCPTKTKGKFLFTAFEFGVSFVWYEFRGRLPWIEVTPNLELLVTFGVSLEVVCHELYT
jgi:hypothetical protein